MTETDNPYYSKGHKNYCIYHFDRSLHSFLYHLDQYLDSLELSIRKIYLKIIKKKIKEMMKKLLFKFIKRLKYKNCILVFRAKGLDSGEIIKEILNS